MVSPGESIRVNGSILFSISRIYLDNGDLPEAEKHALKSIELAKALDAATTGRKLAEQVRNPNMISQLEILEADAMDAGGARPEEVQVLYEDAVERLTSRGSGKVKLKEVCFRLGANALKQGDTTRACEFFKNLMRCDWWGGDDLYIMKGAGELSRILRNPDEKAYYARMADSLSYAVDLADFTNALAMNSIEFARRQKDAEIIHHKHRAVAFILLAIALLAVSILLGLLLADRRRVLREIENKTACLQ